MRGSDIAGVFKRNPRVACFKKPRNHFFPKMSGIEFFEEPHFPAFRFFFIRDIFFFKCFAIQVMQFRRVIRREKRPFFIRMDALHEKIGYPVRGIHVMGSPPIIAGISAQIQKIFNIKMPCFQIGAGCPSAFARSVDCNGCVVGNF